MTSNQEIFRLLDNNELISSYEVLDFRKNKYGFFLKLKVQFMDQSILFSKEYFSIDVRNYSFHWQDNKNNLLIRWDNAPFHKNIETFPHHKHEGKMVHPSTEIGFEDVLNYIIEYLGKK